MCQYDQNIWRSLEGVGEENSVGSSAIANTNISVGDEECSQNIAPAKNVWHHLTCSRIAGQGVFLHVGCLQNCNNTIHEALIHTVPYSSYYSLY